MYRKKRISPFIKTSKKYSVYTGGRIFFVVLFVIILTGVSCKNSHNIIDEILYNKKSYYYIDIKNYPSKNPSLPVGIFDSGTGGLAVMNDILEFRGFSDSRGLKFNPPDSQRVFNNESFIYLADLANMPYGSYSLENNSELLIEHIFKDVQFLLGNKYYQTADSKEFMNDKEAVKAIVIACNTATAFGLDTIRSFIKKTGLDIGIIGVIDAGSSAAVRNFSVNESGSIAVLATDGTVKSGAYVSTLKLWIKDLGLQGDIMIVQQAGIGVAESIDEDQDFINKAATRPRNGYKGPSETASGEMQIKFDLWERYDFNMENRAMLFEGDKNNPVNLQLNSVENYINFHLVTLLEKLKSESSVQPLKSVIFGCTHYPFYEKAFRETLDRLREYKEDGKFVYKDLISENVLFINPGVYVAGQLYDYLERKELLNKGGNVKNEFYISVPNLLNKNVLLREDGSFTYEYKYGRRAGEIQEYIKTVPFSRKSLQDEILSRLFVQIPVVYEQFLNFNHNNNKTSFLKEEDKIKNY